MSEWKARRFWKAVSIREADGGGHEVFLDERALRTPGKLPLILPTATLAEALAQEWQAQADLIQPQTMPLTRAANSAIERVSTQFEAVADMLAEYGGTDLLSYRATEPAALIALQADSWDPLLDWARSDLGVDLRVTQGVIPVAQDPADMARLRALLTDFDVFGLTALHDLVTLPGSLILGLAVVRGHLDADQSFAFSRIDEEFQAAQWGRDDEAAEAAEARRLSMISAERLWRLSRVG